MPYTVQFERSAERQLGNLPVDVQARLATAIDTLATDPRPVPPTGKKLGGRPARYRLRVGDFRVVYRIASQARTVTVVWVGNRRDAYRD